MDYTNPRDEMEEGCDICMNLRQEYNSNCYIQHRTTGGYHGIVHGTAFVSSTVIERSFISQPKTLKVEEGKDEKSCILPDYL